jgi:hypothetical protein
VEQQKVKHRHQTSTLDVLPDASIQNMFPSLNASPSAASLSHSRSRRRSIVATPGASAIATGSLFQAQAILTDGALAFVLEDDQDGSSGLTDALNKLDGETDWQRVRQRAVENPSLTAIDDVISRHAPHWVCPMNNSLSEVWSQSLISSASSSNFCSFFSPQWIARVLSSCVWSVPRSLGALSSWMIWLWCSDNSVFSLSSMLCE